MAPELKPRSEKNAPRRRFTQGPLSVSRGSLSSLAPTAMDATLGSFILFLFVAQGMWVYVSCGGAPGCTFPVGAPAVLVAQGIRLYIFLWEPGGTGSVYMFFFLR